MQKLKRLIVDNVLEPLISQKFLKAYAAFWVSFLLKIKRPKIIAITGTVGKTTTKELVAAVLGHSAARDVMGTVDWTHGNLNVDVDLLGTLLLRHDGSFQIPWNYFKRIMFLMKVPVRFVTVALNEYPRTWVLECGVCSMSDLEWQASLIRPDVSIVTTIGAAHLEKFKKIESLVFEKGALVRAVKPNGLVVLGQEHPYVRELEDMARASVVKASGEGFELSRNIAKEVCQYYSISENALEDVCRDFKNPIGRLNVIEARGVKIIDDSFNANPLSMKHGLNALGGASDGRRVAILGSMAELGEEEERYHREVGAYARGCAEVIVGVGALAKFYDPDFFYESSAECCDHVQDWLRVGDVCFVKGSGSMKMRMVVDVLKNGI